MKILTIDNIRRQKVLVVDWCCMCKRSRETIGHLLIPTLPSSSIVLEYGVFTIWCSLVHAT